MFETAQIIVTGRCIRTLWLSILGLQNDLIVYCITMINLLDCY